MSTPIDTEVSRIHPKVESTAGIYLRLRASIGPMPGVSGTCSVTLRQDQTWLTMIQDAPRQKV